MAPPKLIHLKVTPKQLKAVWIALGYYIERCDAQLDDPKPAMQLRDELNEYFYSSGQGSKDDGQQ